MILSCLSEEGVTTRDIHEELTTRGRYCFGSVEESDDKGGRERRNTGRK